MRIHFIRPFASCGCIAGRSNGKLSLQTRSAQDLANRRSSIVTVRNGRGSRQAHVVRRSLIKGSFSGSKGFHVVFVYLYPFGRRTGVFRVDGRHQADPKPLSVYQTRPRLPSAIGPIDKGVCDRRTFQDNRQRSRQIGPSGCSTPKPSRTWHQLRAEPGSDHVGSGCLDFDIIIEHHPPRRSPQRRQRHVATITFGNPQWPRGED